MYKQEGNRQKQKYEQSLATAAEADFVHRCRHGRRLHIFAFLAALGRAFHCGFRFGCGNGALGARTPALPLEERGSSWSGDAELFWTFSVSCREAAVLHGLLCR